MHNVSCDDWFCKKETNNDKLSSLLKLLKTRKKYLEKQKEPENTWEAFDYFSLSDLEKIIEIHWNELSHIFQGEKNYKNQTLPRYSKSHLLTKLSQIRKARNEIFHNKPTKIKFKKDLEILLLRFDYNFIKLFKSAIFQTLVAYYQQSFKIK